MKKRKKKKNIQFIFAILFAVYSFFGCSNENQENEISNDTDKFSVQSLAGKELHFDSVINFQFCEQLSRYIILGYSNNYKSEGNSYELYSCSREFEDIEIIDIGLKNNERIVKWDADENGNFIALISQRVEITDEDDSSVITVKNKEYLKKYTFSDNKCTDYQLDEICDDFTSVSELFLIDKDQIVLNTYNCDTGINSFIELNEQFEIISLFSDDSIEWIESVDKKYSDISVIYYSDDKKYIGTLDLKSKCIKELYEFKTANETMKLLTGDNNINYIMTSSKILKIDSGKCSIYCDLTLLGFNGNNIHSLDINSNGDLLILEYDDFADKRNMYLISQNSPDNPNQEKQIITVACGWIDEITRSEIVRFNKSNEFYKIILNDYSQYNTNDNPEAGMNKLEQEFLHGKAPDIILYSSFQNSKALENLGAFSDLYTFMNNDDSFDKNELLTNVLEAYENNGCLYSVPINFQIMTLCGLSQNFIAKDKWDINEMIDSYNNSKINSLLESNNKKHLVEEILLYSLGLYVEYDNGISHFDSEEFINLLEFFDKTGTNDKSNDNPFAMTNGNALLDLVCLSSFDEFHTCAAGYWNKKDISFVGFPGINGGSSLISSELQFSINDKSVNKKLAWDFIKGYLSYDYQKNIEYKFPVNKKALDEAGARSTIIHTDENGEVIENKFYFDLQEKDIGYLTDKEKEKCINLIFNSNRSFVYDSKLYAICQEELAPFIEGEQSASETSRRIHERVLLYLNEKK
ncbi:MAG: ABC transporter substrate-binding protein [Oscillospiraceae bacterium]|nr:ABC transporter substrate-binding protein [Oscillospiraceae bacterium]